MSSKVWRFVTFVCDEGQAIEPFSLSILDFGNILSVWHFPCVCKSTVPSETWTRFLLRSTSYLDLDLINEVSLSTSDLSDISTSQRGHPWECSSDFRCSEFRSRKEKIAESKTFEIVLLFVAKNSIKSCTHRQMKLVGVSTLSSEVWRFVPFVCHESLLTWIRLVRCTLRLEPSMSKHCHWILRSLDCSLPF